MKNKGLVVALMALVALTMLFGIEKRASFAASTEWKIQIPFPGPFWKGQINHFAKFVAERTKRQLALKVLPQGSVLSIPKIADGVAQNVIQIGFSASIFSAGKVPEMNLLHGIPFLYDSRDQMIEVVYSYKDGAVFKLLQRAFKEKVKAYYMGYGLTGMNGLFGNFRVSSIGDIKGKKIKSTGAANGLIAQLGGSPISLPGSELYTAFQRGTIDGTVYPFHAIRSYKLTEVVKNIVFPPFYPGTEGGVYCNISAFEKLPASVQADLKQACIDWAKNEFTPAALAYSAGAVDQIVKSGITKNDFSDADIKKLRKIVVEKVLPRYIKKTPRCQELWGLIEAYCKEKGLL